MAIVLHCVAVAASAGPADELTELRETVHYLCMSLVGWRACKFVAITAYTDAPSCLSVSVAQPEPLPAKQLKGCDPLAHHSKSALPSILPVQCRQPLGPGLVTQVQCCCRAGAPSPAAEASKAVAQQQDFGGLMRETWSMCSVPTFLIIILQVGIPWQP